VIGGTSSVTEAPAVTSTVPGVVDPAAVDAVRSRVRADGEVGAVLDRRVPELVAYQSARYARAYADVVEKVRQAEEKAVPGSTQLTEAVARNLYKLMAYKDEYEVARLALDPAMDEQLAAQFGPGSRASYRLHPPVLRALGMKDKLELGPWFKPAFQALYRMRRVRGTRLDLFGYAEVRRIERALVTEYRRTIEEILDRLDGTSLPQAVEIAELPDLVRGYEHVKLAGVEKYHLRLAELQSRLP
ncbi:MAG TPA: DUF6537 domain-containing protein, partial [Streptomyces sp.]|uniref:DUF6537 domain-containing protein n=1 Tax=Streptomyces sp. TaxID=1931 RepID=UPI002BB5EA40